MQRLTDRLYAMRHEQANGLYLCLLAALLAWRPNAAALAALETFYSISLSVQVYGISLFVCGVLLLFLPKVPTWLYLVLTSPILIYTIFLGWSIGLDVRVGPIGCVLGAYVWLSMMFQRLLSHRKLRIKM